MDRRTGQLEGCGGCGEDALGDGDRLVLTAQSLEQHQELVAALPRDDVPRAHRCPHRVRGPADVVVARAVAVAVVDLLEAVEVAEQDPHLPSGAVAVVQGAFEVLLEELAVRQFGECVVSRLAGERPLGLPARGGVEQLEEDLAPTRQRGQGGGDAVHPGRRAVGADQPVLALVVVELVVRELAKRPPLEADVVGVDQCAEVSAAQQVRVLQAEHRRERGIHRPDVAVRGQEGHPHE